MYFVFRAFVVSCSCPPLPRMLALKLYPVPGDGRRVRDKFIFVLVPACPGYGNREKKGNMTMAASARNLLFGLTLIVLATAGCGNGSELEPPQQPAVLRKKIAIAKKQPPQAVKPKPPLQQAKAEPPLPEKKPMMQQEGTRPESVRQEVGKKLTYSYDPKGKPDPFRPIFAPEDEGVATAKKKPRKKMVPLTPLQKVDLTHLNLVGIIISATGNKALVTDPSGKGYVVTKGTYVGKDFGRVKRILNDRVVVEEEVEDFSSGEMKPRTRELRLQKRPGHV